MISLRSRGRHPGSCSTVPSSSNTLSGFRFSSSFHSVHHVPLHSQTGTFTRAPFCLCPLTLLSQSPSPSRFALLSTRFASTSSKQPTLKERLAALIPHEIEKARPGTLWLLPLTFFFIGESNQGRAWQKVLRTRCCRSLIWVGIPFRSCGFSTHFEF